jgi:dTDP-4-dehydrorhamnose reductase
MAEVNLNPSGWVDSGKIDWGSLKDELVKCTTVEQTLSAYLRLDKDQYVSPISQEDVAAKLLELGDADKAMDFIKMAETRRVMLNEKKSLATVIGGVGEAVSKR